MLRFYDATGKCHLGQATIKRSTGVNGSISLSGTIFDGQEVIQGLDYGWRLFFDDQYFAVTYRKLNDQDKTVEFDAIQQFFWDFSKTSLYTQSSGSHTFEWYLGQLFQDSGYTYDVQGTVLALEKENWGMKNKLDLFNDIIKQADVEFEVSNKNIIIRQQIGSDLTGIVRQGINLSNLIEETDISNFATYIKGYGKFVDENDHSKGRLEAEYTSPLAKVYGKLEMDPYVNESFSVASSFKTELKNKVDATYSVSLKLDIYDLENAGYPSVASPQVGDWIMAIDESLNFQKRIRIIKVDEEFDSVGKRIGYTATCGDLSSADSYQSSLGQLADKVEQVQNDVSLIVQTAANGYNRIYRGTDDPRTLQFKDLITGDSYYQTNGDQVTFWQWDGTRWIKVVDDMTGKEVSDKVDAAMQEMADYADKIDTANNYSQQALEAANSAKQASQEAASSINLALDDVSLAKQNASDALASATQAMTDAKNALGTAKIANEATQTIKSDINTINGTLKLTATKSEVNAVSSSVQSIQTDINIINGDLKLVAKKTDIDEVNQRVTTIDNSVTANTNELKLVAKKTDVEALAKRVTSTESGINVINGQLDAFVKKTVVDDLTKRIKTNELATKANADALELTAKQSDVNSLAGRIGTAENSIKINAKAIEGKASANSVDELTGDLTTAKNQWKVSADGFTADILNVNNKIDNFKIGGTNLIRNSGNPSTLDYWNTNGVMDTPKHPFFYNGTRNLFRLRNPDKYNNEKTMSSARFSLLPKTDYTLSFYAFNTGNLYSADIFILGLKDGDTGGFTVINQIQEGGTYSYNSAVYRAITFNSGDMVSAYLRFDNNGSKDNTQADLYIGDVQLEKGKQATDYSPAPEDDMQAIQANKASIETTAKDLKINYTTTAGTQNWVNNQISVASDKFQVSISSVNDKLGKLRLGGQNLVNNSGNPQNTSSWSTNGSDPGTGFAVTKHVFFQNNTRNMFVIGNSSVTKEFYISSSDIQLQPDRDYTLSFDVFNDGNMKNADVYFIGDDAPKLLISSKRWSTAGDIRESVTFNSGKTKHGHVRFDNNMSMIEGTEGHLFIGDVTLVQGNVPKAWSPPITDLATQANLKVVSDQIDLMVKKNDVINRINVSMEGILIQGNKVRITGQTVIDNAVIKSAMIDTLDASKITAGTLNAANVNIINLNVSKLVGDKTNFVQSAWNGVSQSVLIDSSGLLSIGLSGFVSLTETGMNTFANVGDNYELVGNFQSATVAGTNSTNGSLVSIEPTGDFIGFGQRTSDKDPYSMVFTYWRNAGAGYKKGLNSTEDIYINSAKTLYAKKWGTIDAAKNAYVELGATSINKAGNYPVLGNQGLSSGFAFQGSHVWMLSGTKDLYDMTGTIKGFSGIQGKTILLPTEIPGSGQYAGLVKSYISIKLA